MEKEEIITDSEWVNTERACLVLGVSRRTLNRWVIDGTLPSFSYKDVLFKGRQRKRFNLDYIGKLFNSISGKEREEGDGTRTGQKKETPIEKTGNNILSSSLVSDMVTLQQQTHHFFQDMQVSQTKLHDTFLTLKLKNQSKNWMLLFFLLVIFGLGGYGYIFVADSKVKTLEQKQKVDILKNNITTLETEKQEIGQRFDNALGLLKDRLAEKDNTIQKLEAQITQLKQERKATPLTDITEDTQGGQVYQPPVSFGTTLVSFSQNTD